MIEQSKKTIQDNQLRAKNYPNQLIGKVSERLTSFDFTGVVKVQFNLNDSIISELLKNKIATYDQDKSTMLDFYSLCYLSIIDENLSVEQLLELLCTEMLKLTQFLEASKDNIQNENSEMAVIGTLNQLKTYTLCLLNAIYYQEKDPTKEYGELSKHKTTLLDWSYSIIKIYYFLICSLDIDLSDEMSALHAGFNSSLKKITDSLKKECVRSDFVIAECTHPITMLASCFLFCNENSFEEPTNTAFLALPTGSTELGILLHIMYQYYHKDEYSPKLYLCPVSLHNGKKSYPNLRPIDEIEEKLIVLVDDNVSTGKTLDLVTRELASRKKEVLQLVVPEADIVRSKLRNAHPRTDFSQYSVNILPVSTTIAAGTDLKKRKYRDKLSVVYDQKASLYIQGSPNAILNRAKADLARCPTSRMFKNELKIAGFRHTFLSNFYAVNVVFNDISFPTVEHAYQYAKFYQINDYNLSNEQIIEINQIISERSDTNGLNEPSVPEEISLQNLLDGLFTSVIYSPGTIKKITDCLRKQHPATDDWKSKKLHVMTDMLLQKYSNPELRSLLLDTQPNLLIESNTWGDIFWGYDEESKTGNNYLGRLLMAIRDLLSNISKSTGIIFDIDGTIIDEVETAISLKLQNQIINQITQGKKVVFATGRSFKSVIKILSNLIVQLSNAQLDLISVISNNGNVISKIVREDNILVQKCLQEKSLQRKDEIFTAIATKFDLQMLKGDGILHLSKIRDTSITLELTHNFDNAADEIEKLIKAMGIKNFRIVVPGKDKLDIIPLDSGKLNALKVICPDFDNFACFADQGGRYGNDRGILSLPLAFDVSKSEISGPKKTSAILEQWFR